MPAFRENAQKWLAMLREGTESFESCLFLVRRYVRMGGFTLEDIGTSEEELKELRIKGYKICAQQDLSLLREGTCSYDTYVAFIRQHTEKDGFTLEDIGTSKEELEKLRPQK